MALLRYQVVYETWLASHTKGYRLTRFGRKVFRINAGIEVKDVFLLLLGSYLTIWNCVFVTTFPIKGQIIAFVIFTQVALHD